MSAIPSESNFDLAPVCHAHSLAGKVEVKIGLSYLGLSDCCLDKLLAFASCPPDNKRKG